MNKIFQGLLVPTLLVAALGCEAEEPTPAPAPEPVTEVAPTPEPEAPAAPTAAELPVAEDFEAELLTSVTADELEAQIAALETELSAEEAADVAAAAPPAAP